MQQIGNSDPAPSRWAYRFHRLMLTPMFRKLLRVGLPLGATAAAIAIYLGDQERRDGISLAMADLRASIQSRPEFMLNLMAVDGAGTSVSEDIREIVPIDFPVSSFDVDLDHIRMSVEELPAVQSATVLVLQGGVLQIKVTERVPVALWRTNEGLSLVDISGIAVGPVAQRTDRPELPLIAGVGAGAHVSEALDLFRASAPIADRVRGLVRMGERRWDVILDRGQRIQLPEAGAVQALERVIALSNAQDMLGRDLAMIDMRLADRPTIRMNKDAVASWWQIKNLSVESGNQ